MKQRYHFLIIAMIISIGIPVDICLWVNPYPSSFAWGNTLTNDMFNGIWGDEDSIYSCGITQVSGPTNTDIMLVKADFNGYGQWNRSWGGSDHEAGNDLCGNETQIIVVGWTESYGAGLRDAVIVQWDLVGNFLQYFTWGGPFYDEATSICRNGSVFYVFGTTWSFGAGSADFFLMKLIVGCPPQWIRTWGGPALDYGCSVMCTDSVIYTSGYSNSFGASNSDFVLIKWDPEGNILWNRTWGGPGEDTCQSILIDGNFIYTCGSSSSFGAANRSSMVKWDSQGNIVWNQTRTGIEMSNSFDLCECLGRIYTCGWIGTNSMTNPRMMIEQWDPNGGIINTWLWGDPSSASYGRGIWYHGEKIYAVGYASGNGGTFDAILAFWPVGDYIPGLLFLIAFASPVMVWIVILFRNKRRVVLSEKERI
jgi:hypothetical protein